ncbi:hypothetical protein HNP84_001147 [Thermocatellispora tengchongensis]|uniref:Uncharacterized protein n=1 Tax=Thermocatellispora tengchongensis TaxID=1073253 RepID=A0A840P0L9_9ACTN|nr:hypothetical protein [Thermocatellispora tengchongensis]MBB5131441.1 hypothetical protein [Thermocatellispora tengchongensis]
MTSGLGTHVTAGADVRALERRYRRLLLAYPPGYRAAHGEELIGTLLETAAPGRATPPLAEAVALVHGGLRARAERAATGPAWADGLHLGVTVLVVAGFAALLPYAGSIPVWTGLAGLATLAVLNGWAVAALPLMVLVAARVGAIALGRPWPDGTLLPVFPDAPWGEGPALYQGGGPVAPVAAWALAFLGLAVLAARRVPLRRRSWRWWLLAPPLAPAAQDPLLLNADPTRTPARLLAEVALLLLAVWACHVTGDPRWSLAAAVYVLAKCAELAENLPYAGPRELAHLALLAFPAAAAAVLAHRTRRHDTL